MSDWLTMIFNHYLLAIALTVFCAVIATHTWTTLRARQGQRVRDAGGKLIGSRPASAPYSIPIIGQFFALLWDVEGALRRAREQCGSDVFRICLLGRTFNVISSKNLIDAMLRRVETNEANSNLDIAILRNVFGLPAIDAKAYSSLKPRLDATVQAHVEDSVKRQETLQAFASQLKAHIPDLLTFNPSPVDQEPWERAAQPELSEDRECVTVNLFTLICGFTAHLTTDVLLSPSLLSQEPETAKFLTDFRSSFMPLLTGLPRTFPWPQLPKAHIVRRSLMARTTAFVRAVTLAREDEDPGPEYRDLMDGIDSIKPLLADRQAVFATLNGQNLSGDAIAADFASLLWDINAPNALCFWLLIHLASSAEGLLDKVRDEIRPYASAQQPEGIFGFSVSPRVNLNIDGLVEKCPLLRSCWLETIRVYTRGLDIVSSEAKLSLPTGSADDDCIIEKGARTVLPMWCPNLDSGRWRQAEMWRGERHLIDGDNGPEALTFDSAQVVERLGGIGSDLLAPLSKAFCLSFVATFLALWDIEPINESRGLFPPSPRFAAAIAVPSSTLKTKLRKRRIEFEATKKEP